MRVMLYEAAQSTAARTMSKTAAPKQRATPNPQNDLPSETAISASTIVQPPASNEPPKEANKAVVAAAGAAWLSLPTVDSTPVTTAATVEATQPATDHANAVQINNGSVLIGDWSMFSYLFLILSGVLAVMCSFGNRPRELQRRHGMRKAGHRRDQRRSHRSRLRARAVLRHPDRLILRPGPYRVTCGGR